MTKLATETDVMHALRTGTYSLGDFYDIVDERADTSRDGGCSPVPGHPTDQIWKRRVRGALVTMQRQGKAQRIGRTSWAIQGPVQRPTRLLLIVAGATLGEIELRLQNAAELLRTLDEPADLVLADAPWGLNRGPGRHFADGNGYRRDHTRVVDGYVDVDAGEYMAFTHAWVEQAAAALRPGGQLAAITGPQRAAHVQIAAEQAGLTWVSSIAARKTFPLATTRRPSAAHWTITVMCRGRLDDKRRVFHAPTDQPTARSGHPYPQDVWVNNGCANRVKLLRYDNALPLPLVLRLVTSFSNEGEHVADPFIGSGTTAVACWLTNRKLTAGDVNPQALRFTSARLLAEHAWADQRSLTGGAS